MAERTSKDSLRSFSATRDENGQGLTDDPADQALADDVHAQLMAEPTGDAETARLASGLRSEDATAATEAAIPPENLAHISDATLPRPGEPKGDRPIERATAVLGED